MRMFRAKSGYTVWMLASLSALPEARGFAIAGPAFHLIGPINKVAGFRGGAPECVNTSHMSGELSHQILPFDPRMCTVETSIGPNPAGTIELSIKLPPLH